MREILFRGVPVNPILFKSVEGKTVPCFIVGGFYLDYCYGGCPEGKDYIISYNSTGFGYNDFTLCTKETIGQYTGLKDINGVKIYEGDVLEYETEYMFRKEKCKNIGKVIYKDCNFALTDKTGQTNYWLGSKHIFNLKVIGNVHHNKELIK